MTLTSAGRLLIGTTTDNTVDRLQISGNIRLNTGYVQVINSSNAGLYLNNTAVQWQVYNNTSNQFIINNGAGTTALTLLYDTGAATFSSSVTAGSTTTIGSQLTSRADYGAGITFTNAKTDASDIRNFRIVSDQTVYQDFQIQKSTTLGGSTYSNLLYFAPTGAATFSSSVTVGGAINVGTSGSLQINAGTAATPLITQTTNYTEIYRRNDGVGIYLGGTGDPANYYDNTTHYFRSTGGVTEKMRITSAGRLLLGTTTDNTVDRLQIAGSVKSTGNIVSNGGSFFTNDNGRYGWGAGSTYMDGDAANGYVRFFTAGSERMRITSGGNVGIGVTPSAWNFFTAMQIGNTSYATFANRVYIGSNWYFGTGDKYIASDYATLYQQASGEHKWYNAPSGVAGNTIGFTQAMTLNANGNLGIGTTLPSAPLTVLANASAVNARFLGRSSDGFAFLTFRNNADNATNGEIGISDAQNMLFYAGGSERMRITSGGEVYIAGTTDQGAYNLQVNGTGVWGAGAYVNGSDIRLKENISPIKTALEYVNKMNPISFKYKESYSKDQNIQPGFIAQELKELFKDEIWVNGIVSEGTDYLNVAYQNIIPLLTKAIQEQQIQSR